MSKTPVPQRLHLGVFFALVALISSYVLLDSQLRIGPRWLFPFLVLMLFVPFTIFQRNALHSRAHTIGLAIAGIASIALISSVVVLVDQIVSGGVTASNLLRDAALLWLCNVLVFSLWYWELDCGGPAVRHTVGYTPTDFAFPQTTLGGRFAEGWVPGFTDYLFVAFNTSSAFSPTDTMVLTARAKLLMMAQSLVAIISLAVLAARAINTLT